MPVGPVVHLNGVFLSVEEARVSPFDRAFLFGHAAYEVTLVSHGRLIDLDLHIARLQRTLGALEIPDVWGFDGLVALHGEMVERNALDDGLVYLQATAGDYGARDFAGPETFDPTLYLFATPRPLLNGAWRTGVAFISHEDTRWKRRDLKTTQLVGSALAYRAARREGAFAALLHEDGVVTEAASANAWLVTTGGTLVTRDLSQALLPGVTRARIADIAADAGHTVEARPFTLDEARAAAELFTTSTGAGVLPVISLDGAPIGSGAPGAVTRAVQRLYLRHLGRDAAETPWL